LSKDPAADALSFAIIENGLSAGRIPLPACLNGRTRQCDCLFWDPANCPILQDPEAAEYLKWVYERGAVYRSLREQRIARLEEILQRHGLPLHWEVIARIASSEAPAIFDSPNITRQLLFSNDTIFHHAGDSMFTLMAEAEQPPEEDQSGVFPNPEK
jgi:hypothetical protein